MAVGGAMILGGLAVDATAKGAIAVVALAVALAGIPATWLAFSYLWSQRKLDARVRVAYLVIATTLSFGAMAAGLVTLIESNQRQRPAYSRSGEFSKSGATSGGPAADGTAQRLTEHQ